MINQLNKVLAVAVISLVSISAHAGVKPESHYPLKPKSHSYYSPFNFLVWGLFSRLESLQTASDINTIAIEANKAAIAALEEKVAEPIETQPQTVTLDIDCTENSQALAQAYSDNITASELWFTIAGECYGGFQPATSGMPDLHIMGAIDATLASIIPSTDSSSISLIANDNNVSLENLSIVAGVNDFNVIDVTSNASIRLDSVELSAAAGNDYMVRVSNSSVGSLSNVTINGNEQLRRGVFSTSGSYLTVSDSKILGTLETSANLTTNGTLRINGLSEFSNRIAAFQGTVNIGSQSVVTASGLSLSAGSNMQMSSDSSLISNDRVSITESSRFKARNLTVVDEDVYVQRGSTFMVENLAIENGRLRVRYSSNAQISEGQVISQPGSYALDVTNRSIVMIDSEDESPFIFNGRATVENSSLEVESAIFDSALELEFGSVAILGADVELLFGYEEQSGSAVYFE